MSVRRAHLAEAALAVVMAEKIGTEKAGAEAAWMQVSPPEISKVSEIYRRAEFDLSLDRDFYPEMALRHEVEGFSVVVCQVGLDGGVMQCVVDSDSPARYGFGKAHALMLLTHARFDTANYPPGTWLRNCFHWTLM